jgi:hypothetical protein
MSNLFKRIGYKLAPPSVGDPVNIRNIIKALLWMPLIPAIIAATLVFGGVEGWNDMTAANPAKGAVASQEQPAVEAPVAPATGALGNGIAWMAADRYEKEVEAKLVTAKSPEEIDAAYFGVACGAYRDLFGNYEVVPDYGSPAGQVFMKFVTDSNGLYLHALIGKMGWNETGAYLVNKVTSLVNGETALCR